MFEHKEINGQPVKVHHIRSLSDLDSAQVLFVPHMGRKSMQNILRFTHGKKVLTISDSRGFAELGGMIQMYKVAQKIKLKINLSAVHEEDLNIRSSLLKIAQVIKKEG